MLTIVVVRVTYQKLSCLRVRWSSNWSKEDWLPCDTPVSNIPLFEHLLIDWESSASVELQQNSINPIRTATETFCILYTRGRQLYVSKWVQMIRKQFFRSRKKNIVNNNSVGSGVHSIFERKAQSIRCSIKSKIT